LYFVRFIRFGCFNLQASQHFHCFAFIVKRFRVFVRRFLSAPVHRYHVDAGVNLAHASQHRASA
ncbi:hypothetical protein ABLN72_02060, partial [Mycobacterium tuberculosis]